MKTESQFLDFKDKKESEQVPDKIYLPENIELTRRLSEKLIEYRKRVDNHVVAMPQTSSEMAYIAPEVLEGLHVVIPHNMLNELLSSKVIVLREWHDRYPNNSELVNNAFRVIYNYIFNEGKDNIGGTGLSQ